MKTINSLALFFCLCSLIPGLHAQEPARSNNFLSEGRSFIENKGQWNNQIRFASRLPGANFIVLKDGFCFDSYSISPLPETGKPVQEKRSTQRKGNVIKLIFGNGNEISFTGYPGRQLRNYFYGSDPTRWVKSVREYNSLLARNVYKDIDISLKLEEGSPRFDFIVRPGGNPRDIAIGFEGADHIMTTDKQVEFLTVSGGAITIGKLYAYQLIDGLLKDVECSFVTSGSRITFSTGDYDGSKPLIIDPIIYSSYAGGTEADEIRCSQTDKDNNLIVAGWTQSNELMTTPGAYCLTNSGGMDAFISKYHLMGTDKGCIFSTYLGGSNDDIANSVDVDSYGNIYIAGETNSENYPVKNPVSPFCNGKRDILLSKLNSAGDSLCYSTYIGGSKDEYATAIAVGASCSAYLTGGTFSENFPSVTEYSMEGAKGLEDAFILKVSTSGSLLSFATLMTTAGNERGNALSVDESQMSVIVGGETNNARFYTYPNSGPNTVFDKYQNGGYDGFIARFGSTGGKCDFAGFFGGAIDDKIKAVCLESNGKFFVAGETNSTKTKLSPKTEDTEFPITSSSYSINNHGGTDAFLAEFGRNGEMIYTSTFLGGKGNDAIAAIGFNKSRSTVYVAGTTTSSDYPVLNDPTMSKYKGNKDVFVSEFNLSGTQLQFSTLVGGAKDDIAYSMAIDSEGDVYVVGSTASNNFPVQDESAGKQFLGGATDGFITKITQNTLKFDLPKSGEYCAGSQVQISWDAQGFNAGSQFSIGISADSGKIWNNIANGVTGSEYNWNIPLNFPPAESYKLRVSSTSGIISNSTGYISIVSPPSIKQVSLLNSSGSNCAGDSVAFMVEAEGKDLKYKWMKNGSVIANATNKLFIIPSLALSDAGKYEVTVSNKCQPEAVSQALNLSVKPTTNITSEPESQTVKKGSPATFKVIAEGVGLAYEWYKDGAKMLSESSPVLSIATCQKQDEGSYNCLVRGECGIDTSAVAILSVDTVTSVNERDYNITYCGIISELYTSSSVNLSVDAASASGVSIGLYNYTGALVAEYDSKLEQGLNNVVMSLPVHLTPGIYWIVLRSSTQACYRKFIVDY